MSQNNACVVPWQELNRPSDPILSFVLRLRVQSLLELHALSMQDCTELDTDI